jgi:CDP-diacylglycerol--serine O-phosphatidyltransferase
MTTTIEPVKKVARWRYVIPNALTSMSLVLGLGVIAVATEGNFELAGWLTVWCVLLDKLDGTAARLLGASSKFGAELDSLADLVVFGVAPAVTVLLFTRSELELFAIWQGYQPLMYAMLALFVVCASLRLAKFNVLVDSGPPVFFGLPTTFTGGILALLLIVGLQRELDMLLQALPLIALAFGLLMVSNLVLPKIGHNTSRPVLAFQFLSVALCYVFGFMRILPEFLLGISLFFVSMGIGYGLLHRDELLSSKPEHDDDLDLEPQVG